MSFNTGDVIVFKLEHCDEDNTIYDVGIVHYVDNDKVYAYWNGEAHSTWVYDYQVTKKYSTQLSKEEAILMLLDDDFLNTLDDMYVSWYTSQKEAWTSLVSDYINYKYSVKKKEDDPEYADYVRLKAKFES